MEYEESDDLRTIKALPLWQGFLAAIIAPILLGFLFAILGAQHDPFILQLEMILVSIAFCLTGILTRSKLKGLLTIFAAPIAWIPMFLLDTLTSGWYVNPYGLIAEIAGPISAILDNTGMLGPEFAQYASYIQLLLIIVDLLILEIFIALFLGFFLSTLATGIWTKKGTLSILSIITKPIAAIFVILILVTVPFVYHGITTFADGGISLAAGATEFMGIFGYDLGGGTGAQDGLGIDLSDPDVIENLTRAAERAEKWFRRSSIKFGHVQGNFYVSIIKGFLPEEYQGINLQEITSVLSISGVLASISSEIPDLLLGFNSLVAGFDRTFGVLSTTDLGGGFGGGLGSSANAISATYNPEFNIGLDNISTAIDHFNNSKEGVSEALEEAKGIVEALIVDETGELAQAFGMVDEVEIGYGLILEIARGAIDFLNATYKTTLAIEDLGDSAFINSTNWLKSASGDLEDANTTLDAIDTTGLNPDSFLPFYGIVEILKDMTNLLTYFSYAATNGTECYSKMEDVLGSIDALNFNGSDLATISTGLDALSTDVTEASTLFSAASDYIEVATSLSGIYATKTYGDMIDTTLKPILTDFSSMLATFSNNITQMNDLVEALEYTVISISSFTSGFSLFNSTFTEHYEANPADFNGFFTDLMADPDFNRSEELLNFCVSNASAGHYYVSEAQAISSDVKTTWQTKLHNPAPPDTPSALGGSIAGLAQGAISALILLRGAASLIEAEEHADLIQEFYESLDEIKLTDVFSGGGP
ncbi:MAG: hypothetical protein ACXACU_08735 [Candidatus Hodarchaeales archaeon]|jgi:hypothetical protein